MLSDARVAGSIRVLYGAGLVERIHSSARIAERMLSRTGVSESILSGAESILCGAKIAKTILYRAGVLESIMSRV
jgi:hypothetical protein